MLFRSVVFLIYYNARLAPLIEAIGTSDAQDGQLSESPLTAKDIKKIEQSFLKTLSAQYHERVEYPPLEEKTSEQQV